MHTLDSLDAASLRSDVPDFRPGDTLKVHVRVVEGTRSRVQVFQGVVIRRQGNGVRETFTVRKISFGVGVERTFPVHTPVHREDRDRHPRRRAPREALLPARTSGQEGEDPREARHHPRALSSHRPDIEPSDHMIDEPFEHDLPMPEPYGMPGQPGARRAAVSARDIRRRRKLEAADS